MFHPRGEDVDMSEESLLYAFASANKNEGQKYGLAVDDMVKNVARRKFGFMIPQAYAPYDVISGSLHIEIKSTEKVSFTFSEEELHWIEECKFLDMQYHVYFYKNNIAKLTTKFLGLLTLAELQQLNWVDSQFNSTQKYLKLEDVEAALARKYPTLQR